jgi:hypothetical protein
MDDDPPPDTNDTRGQGRGGRGGSGRADNDGVVYLPGVAAPSDPAETSEPGAAEVLTGCVQLVGLVIKLVLLLALLAMIIWFVVVVLTTV